VKSPWQTPEDFLPQALTPVVVRQARLHNYPISQALLYPDQALESVIRK